MTLPANAIITVDELITYLGKDMSGISVGMLTLYNAAAGATSATVVKAGDTLTLTVVGGASAHVTALDLTAAANDTVGELIAVIIALGKGWVVKRLCASAQASADMYDFPSTNALLAANTQRLTGFNSLMLEEIIGGVSSFIEAYCGRPFADVAATEYVDGEEKEYLILKRSPIVSITSVAIFDYQAQTVVSTLTENEHYIAYKERGQLFMAGGWAPGVKNYRVVYTAGYATIPEEVKQACKTICAAVYALRTTRGYKSESMGSYSYSTDTGGGVNVMGAAVPADALAALDMNIIGDRNVF